jgi:hypothetical protein
LIAALALWVISSTPKTFEDLEIAKIEALHGIKTFRWQMTVSLHSEGKDYSMKATMLRDGARGESDSSMPNVLELRTVTDGSTIWTLRDPQKVYEEAKLDPNEVFDPKKLLIANHPHSFNYAFGTDNTFGFACDPPLNLMSLATVQEGGIALRKAVATSTNEKGQTLTLTQWFLPDKWILKRFTIDGKGDGGPFHADAEATTIDFKAKIGPKDFNLDPAMLTGYTKQDVHATGSGGGG